MPETSNRAENAKPRGGSRRQRRLPVLPVVLLVLVAFLVLAFVTFRQLRGAREDRLRLLASFSDRVEQTIPRRAGRFARIIQEHRDTEDIEEYIRIVPHLRLVGEPRELDENAETAEDEARKLCQKLTGGAFGPVGVMYPCLVLQSHNDQIELVYVGAPGTTPPGGEPAGGAGDPLDATSDHDAGSDADDLLTGPVPDAPPPEAGRNPLPPEDEDDPEPKPAHVFYGRIDLRPLLQEILISDVFDSVLVASARTGRVLHQEGEPALVVNDLAALLGRADPPMDLATDGPATAIVDVRLGPSGDDALGMGGYKLFLQPVSLDADLPGGLNVAIEEWIAAGLMADDHLLASSFSASPVLLFFLVASFPLALVSWPFLKLWLISPRQSMSRLDLAALVVSSVLALVLGALLVFDLLFLSRIHADVDEQLKDAAVALETNLRKEIEQMKRQLDAVHDPQEAWGVEIPLFARFTRQETAPAPDPADENVATEPLLDFLRANEQVRFESYPYLHSIFWADANGEQKAKLPLREYALFTSSVEHRDYFKCALHRRGGYALEGLDGRICLEPIFSNTTGRDLVALARRSDDRVAVLTTVLVSLRRPLLAPGFGFAVVDGSGRAVFHSDARRNLTESFLKASDEDHLLAALLRDRRPGHLTVSYWGRRHRLFVEPIEGLPWSLVVYRSTDGLRLRNFEMVYDFLAGMVPYLLLVLTALVLAVYPWRASLIWPRAHHIGLYRLLVLVVAALNGVFALVLVFLGQGPLFWTTVLAPLAAAVCAAAYLASGRAQRARDAADRAPEAGLEGEGENGDAERSDPGAQPLQTRIDKTLRKLELPAFLFGFGATLCSLLVDPKFLTAFLFMAATIGFATWFWLRSFFLRRQRRMAFIAALAALLHLAAILPAVAFFSLAQSRQHQYLVQESQAGLAKSDHARKSLLASWRFQLEGLDPKFFAGYDDELALGRKGLLAAFFGTEEGNACEWRRARSGGLWPASRGGGGSPLHFTVLSSRPVPLTEIATGRRGLDLSRFEDPPHQWSWISDPKPRLIGRFTEPWATGDASYLTSSLATAPDVRPARGALVALLLGGLLVLPALLARFLADKVLLARLATSEDAAKPLRQMLDEWQDKKVGLRRLLFVTTVPDLAVREARRSETYRIRSFPDLQREGEGQAGATDPAEAGGGTDEGKAER